MPQTMPPVQQGSGTTPAAARAAPLRIARARLGPALAIVLAVCAWSALETAYAAPDRPPRIHPEIWLSGIVVYLTGAMAIAVALPAADRKVDGGVGAFAAYGSALFASAAIATVLQWSLRQPLHLRVWSFDPALGAPVLAEPFMVFCEYLIWGSLVVFIYVSRRSASRATEDLKAAQVQRAQARSRTAEWRLQALRARIEPQFIFGSLERVRDLYERDAAQGHAVLGDLIAYLRGALPRLREDAVSLREEADLAAAYLKVIGSHGCETLALDVGIDEVAGRAAMPTMVLLPLIGRLLPSDPTGLAPPAAIRIAASSAAGRLRVEVACRSDRRLSGQFDGDPQDVEQRLAALYGDRWSLATRSEGGRGAVMTLEIPHEPADGRHR